MLYRNGLSDSTYIDGMCREVFGLGLLAAASKYALGELGYIQEKFWNGIVPLLQGCILSKRQASILVNIGSPQDWIVVARADYLGLSTRARACEKWDRSIGGPGPIEGEEQSKYVMDILSLIKMRFES